MKLNRIMLSNTNMHTKRSDSNAASHSLNSLEIAQESAGVDGGRNIGNSISYIGEPIIIQANQSNNYPLGAAFAVISAILYAFMVVFAKLAYSINSRLTPYDLWWVRGITSIVWLSGYAYIK